MASRPLPSSRLRIASPMSLDICELSSMISPTSRTLSSAIAIALSCSGISCDAAVIVRPSSLRLFK